MPVSKSASDAARKLSALSKKVPKTFSEEERERRRNWMISLNKKRKKAKRASKKSK